MEEVINEALTPAEAEQFISFLRSTMEEKQAIRSLRYTGAYLWAVKDNRI